MGVSIDYLHFHDVVCDQLPVLLEVVPLLLESLWVQFFYFALKPCVHVGLEFISKVRTAEGAVLRSEEVLLDASQTEAVLAGKFGWLDHQSEANGAVCVYLKLLLLIFLFYHFNF